MDAMATKSEILDNSIKLFYSSYNYFIDSVSTYRIFTRTCSIALDNWLVFFCDSLEEKNDSKNRRYGVGKSADAGV